MGSFIAKQPNGLYCRFSSVTDCPTHYNMTKEDYIKLCQSKAAEEARKVIQSFTRPFSEVKESFTPNNMSKKKFKYILKEMERPAEDCEMSTV